jgi:diguanylate cyclase (GGDEF)-like protein
MQKATIAQQANESKHPVAYRIIINLTLLSCLLLLFVISAATYSKIPAQNNIQNSYLNSQAVKDNAYQLLLNFDTVILHQKDYLITGNNIFTPDTDALLTKSHELLNQLDQLTKNTPSQHEFIQSLTTLSNDRINLLLQIRTLKENDGFTSLNNAELLHKTQSLSEEMTYTVTQLLNTVTNNAISSNNTHDELLINKIIFISASSMVFLLLLAAFAYNRELFKYSRFNKNSIDTYSELHSILSCASDMIVAIDTSLKFLNFNAAYENDFQLLFNKKIKVGMSLEDAYSNLPNVKEKILSIWKESLDGNAINQTIDFTANEKAQAYEVTSNPIINSQREIIGAVQIIRNTTQRSNDQLELKQAYEKLNVGMLELQERNEKITLIVEMSDVILACESLVELSEVIAKYCHRILSFAGGTLYIMHPSKDYLESTASWGISSTQDPTFPHDNCWALRLGKIHFSGVGSTELLCGHIKIDADKKCSYLCVPLIAQNDIYGLLQLESKNDTGSRSPLDNEKTLIKALAELAALSLANVRLRENLRYHSIRDPLTSLYNRRYLEYYMTKVIVNTKNVKADICLLMLDLDHFKSINDTYGHDTGDLALKEFSLILSANSRPEDLAVRYGGEEFVLLLCDTTLAVAKQRAETIRVETQKILIRYENQQIGTITVSIGVATLPENDLNFKGLIESADKALYQAKHTGRNKIVVAQDLQSNKQSTSL